MKRLSVFLTVLCLMAPAAAFGQVVDMEGSFLEPLQQRDSVREMLHRQNYLFRLLVFLVLFVMIINWGYYGTDFVAADFIYGRF